MELFFAATIGILYGAGLYMILRRSIVKIIVGLILMSHGASLLIFTAGGLVRAGVPIISKNSDRLTGIVADPLPQALILTAIVISFGVLAFALVLLQRTYKATKTDDLDIMRSTDT